MGILQPITSSEPRFCWWRYGSREIYFGTSAIVRTLNATYGPQRYGLGNVNTTYPISAFITDLVYVGGSKVVVDTQYITVSQVPWCGMIGSALIWI